MEVSKLTGSHVLGFFHQVDDQPPVNCLTAWVPMAFEGATPPKLTNLNIHVNLSKPTVMKEQHGCGEALESPPCYGVTPTAQAEINRRCLFVKSITLLPSSRAHVHQAVTCKNISYKNSSRQCNFTVFK